MSIKEIINKIIKNYRRGLVSYDDTATEISRIMNCNHKVAEIIIDNGLYK